MRGVRCESFVIYEIHHHARDLRNMGDCSPIGYITDAISHPCMPTKLIDSRCSSFVFIHPSPALVHLADQ